jgi:putative aldouronate transport system substrate-binding protein
MLNKYPNVKRSYDVGVVSQNYLESDLMDRSFNGSLYILPQQTPGNALNVTNWGYGIFVRADVPRTLGVDPATIKNRQQLYDFMVKARDYGFRDVNGNPTIVTSTYQEGNDVWSLYADGGDMKLTDFSRNADGSVTHDWLTPEYVDRHMFVWRLVNEGLLDRECFRQTATLADTKAGNGTALFYAGQYRFALAATMLTGIYSARPDMRYVPVGPMTYRNGQTLVQTETQGRSGSPVLIFPTTNKNLDATFRYIDYLNTIEGMTLADYGIEGQTYVRNAQGQPRLIPDYLRRKAAGDSTWEDAMRQVGGIYLGIPFWYGSQKMEWFGESAAGEADSAIPELEAYKLLRPAVQLPGIPLYTYQGDSPDWPSVNSFAFEGTIERDRRERAYFANTEAEARAALLDWQNYLRTQQNGVFMRWLDFMSQQARTRNNIAF